MPHCLDEGTVKEKRQEYFKGSAWEKSIQNSDIQNRSK